MRTALREASHVCVTSVWQLQEVSNFWAPMSCEKDLSGNDGCSSCPRDKALGSLRSASLLHPGRAPHPGKGKPGKEGGKMRKNSSWDLFLGQRMQLFLGLV